MFKHCFFDALFLDYLVKMAFIDVHAHLDFEIFDSDREILLEEMREKNIFALTNTLSYENYVYTKKIFNGSLQVQTCPGLYPGDALSITDVDLAEYFDLIREDYKLGKVKALGEVGLDFTYTETEEQKELQEKRFREMIELGWELDIPLIIHTRKAELRVLEVLQEYVEAGFNKFVLHCFSGKKKLIEKIISLKLYCSIPLIVLNTQSFQILVKELPMSQLLVETDSPFLNPQKIRNSPLNIPIIYKEIAKIKGFDEKEIENIIYNNYIKLML